MLIVCPTCSSEFAIEAERIGPTGRVVRCATCRGAWFVPPVETEAAPLEPGRGARRGVRGRGKPAGFGGAPVQEGSTALLVLAIGLTLVIGMALAFRTTIVKTVPESAAAFALIGLPVNLVGLQLAGVTSEMTHEPGGPVLVVAGEITNPTARPVSIPPLALTIEGHGGELLYNWQDRSHRGELAPQETRRFQARLPQPPPEGQRVVVAFTPGATPSPVASR
jgi:predicted Zn finger-like uncharacterized protein